MDEKGWEHVENQLRESLSLITVTFTDVHENKLQLLIKPPRLLGNTLLVPPSEKWL